LKLHQTHEQSFILTRLIVATAVLLLASIACSLPFLGDDPGPLSEATIAAAATQIALATGGQGLSASPPVQVVTPETALPAPSTGTPQPTPLGAPGEPPPGGQTMTDRSSAILADEHRSVGDYFDMNFYERPFTSEDMEYVGYLDLGPRIYLSYAAPWAYATINLQEAPPANADAFYAVELDWDRDGRGDWLIVARAPSSTEWTTDGVTVYVDGNKDVGGRLPVQADTEAGDGYESIVFDEGQGMGEAAAWVRRAPNDAPAVQIAFRLSMQGQDGAFIWGVWAAETLEPDQFDINDHISHEQAGSPLINNRFYPLQDLALVDNSCRWVFGYAPGSPAPGLCYFNTPTPTVTPVPTYTP
jgi:hypothetical protein